MRAIIQGVILITGLTMLFGNRRAAEELVRSEKRSPFGGQPRSLQQARRAVIIGGAIFVFAATFGLITGR